uniref:Putative secreted protein n=1 Tax=Panstrongylus lignarius TaxID=156445 RepID=A0A224Y1L6_9HEMI
MQISLFLGFPRKFSSAQTLIAYTSAWNIVEYFPRGTCISTSGLTPNIPAPVPHAILDPSVNHKDPFWLPFFQPLAHSALDVRVTLNGISKLNVGRVQSPGMYKAGPGSTFRTMSRCLAMELLCFQ